MKTVTLSMNDMCADLKATAKDLLLIHSTLTLDPLPSNFVGWGEYVWQPLSVEGARLQSRLRECLLSVSCITAVLAAHEAARRAAKNDRGS